MAVSFGTAICFFGLQRGQSRGLVDLRHQLHVTQTFIAVALWSLVFEDAVGEVVGLHGELLGIMSRLRHIDLLSADFRGEMDSLISKCRIEFEHSLRSVDA